MKNQKTHASTLPPEQANKVQNHHGIRFKSSAIVLGFVLLFIGILLWNFYINSSFRVTFYRLEEPVAFPCRIVHLSDLHNSEYGEHNCHLLDRIAALAPDMICITGDMTLKHDPDIHVAEDLCTALTQIAPVYYLMGNHEYEAYFSGQTDLPDRLSDTGVTMLRDTTAITILSGTPCIIGGMAETPGNFDRYNAPAMMNELQSFPGLRLLLTHYPENFTSVLKDYTFELGLSGHYHGGTVVLPFIGGLYTAAEGFFPKTVSGYHRYTNNCQIISSGLGQSSWVPRINNQPELVVIDLIPHKEQIQSKE